MCTGSIDTVYVLKALLDGADGVLIGGCHPGDCHYQSGNYRAARKIEMLKPYSGWQVSIKTAYGSAGSARAKVMYSGIPSNEMVKITQGQKAQSPQERPKMWQNVESRDGNQKQSKARRVSP